MKARLFSWLEGTREEMTREEIGLMVREFMDDLERWLDEGRDYKVVARGLERVRVRLLVSSEMSRSGDGMKKKEPAGLCAVAVLELVEREIRLVREGLENPGWFGARLKAGPLAVWRSSSFKMEIVELALGLSLARVLWTPGGKLMEYEEIIKLLELILGIELPNYRELKREIFNRKKELTVFLKRLIFLIEQLRMERDGL